MINALEEVIKDFNAKINEQFGENFKQLNEAVGALLTWQENYKEHVESLTADFEEVRSGITQTKDAVVTIGEQSRAIPETMQTLKEVVQTIDHQISTLNAHLDAVAGLREKALEAFPVIEQNIEELTTNFSEKVREKSTLIENTMTEQRDIIRGIIDQNTRTLNEATQQHRETTDLFRETSKGIADQSQEALDGIKSGMSEAIESYKKQIENATRDQFSALDSVSSGLHQNIEDSLSKTNDLIQKSFTEFDKQMQSEMERSIETMGSHLASLSEKFVQDYTPVTEGLKRLVDEMSRIKGR